jgi:hypothetical protein
MSRGSVFISGVYVLVGELKDYVVAGHAELLFRKTRVPLSEFEAPASSVR